MLLLLNYGGNLKYSEGREGKGVTRPNWARKVREMIVDMGQNNRR